MTHILNERFAARIEVAPEPTVDQLTLADYQRGAALQVRTDEGGGTVLGMPLLQYMIAGSRNEFKESLENSQESIGRSTPLVFDPMVTDPWGKSVPRSVTLHPQYPTEASSYVIPRSRRHRALHLSEEVGDFAWYMVNTLSLLGIKAKEQESGPPAIYDLFDARTVRDFPAGSAQRTSPGEFYYLSAVDYFDALDALWRPTPQDTDAAAIQVMRLERITKAADMVLAAASLLLQNHGLSLARSLHDNRTKVRRRLRQDTIFNHPNEH